MELSSVSPLRIGQEITESLLNDGIAVKARVGGTSMIPWLRSGDIVVLDKPAPYRLGKGDIVVFRRGEKLVIHRVIAMKDSSNGRFFLTKGDSCRLDDGYTAASEIIGRASACERKSASGNLQTATRLNRGRFLASISRYTWPFYYFYFKFTAIIKRLLPT